MYPMYSLLKYPQSIFLQLYNYPLVIDCNKSTENYIQKLCMYIMYVQLKLYESIVEHEINYLDKSWKKTYNFVN